MHNLPIAPLSVQDCRRDKRTIFVFSSIPDHAIDLWSRSYGDVAKNADCKWTAPTLTRGFSEGGKRSVLVIDTPSDVHMNIILAKQLAEPVDVI